MHKTVLLTGWLGYIGSHACVAFEKAGIRTVLLDNLSNSSIGVLDALETIVGRRPTFYEADVRNRDCISQILASERPHAVVHFAGLKAVGASVRMPFEYYDNNVRGSLVLFEEMEKARVRNVIFSSSATVYQADNPLPFKEDARLGTTNPYGTTKLVNECLLKDLAFSKSWYAVALRYFNPIGAHESGLIGERPNGIPNNLLPYVLDVASGKRETVSVYGNDYPTPDGTGVRDYIHVCDLAEAHLAAFRHLESVSEGGYFDCFNVWTGHGTSVLEMIAMAEKASGREIAHMITSRRPGDIAEAVADVSKIEHAMGWKALRGVEEGVASSWGFVNADR